MASVPDSARILVTGASGFLGRHLIQRLLPEEAHLYAVTTASNLPEPQTNLTWLQADITKADDIAAVVAAAAPTHVFHLAAFGVTAPNTDAAQAANVNVTGSINLFDALVGTGVTRILQVGTGYQYGAQAMPVDERAAQSPENVYAICKMTADRFAVLYGNDHGLPVVRMRLFPVYGPAQPPVTFIHYLMQQIANGRPCDLTPGQQIRDYLYVSDAIDALVAAAFSPSNIDGEAFNIGGGEPFTLRQLAARVTACLGLPSTFRWGAKPYRPGELMALWANNEKAAAVLDWRPAVSLDDGIRRVWQDLQRPAAVFSNVA